MNIYASMRPMASIDVSAETGLSEEIVKAAQPTVLRGFVSHWPAVEALRDDLQLTYLQERYNGRPVHLMRGDAETQGRLFYNDDLSGFNFTRSQADLRQVLTTLAESDAKSAPPTLYVGSTAVDQILPGFRADNPMPGLDQQALVSIWMGNRSRIAAHYDAPDNIACNVAGRRRFTLFPPEQMENLYIGPLDFTPAGQPASLVDFYAPDLDRFPRFAEAIEHGLVAELEAGDAIYVPSMWWHHVEGLESVNVLVNYWWRQVPNYIGTPGDALEHAILSIRELPEEQRAAWRTWFEQYVFSPQPQSHIPEARRGVLNPVDDKMARQLRAKLVNQLNR